jgi:hypothetical protein
MGTVVGAVCRIRSIMGDVYALGIMDDDEVLRMPRASPRPTTSSCRPPAITIARGQAVLERWSSDMASRAGPGAHAVL